LCVWDLPDQSMPVVSTLGWYWAGACRMESTSLVNRSGSGVLGKPFGRSDQAKEGEFAEHATLLASRHGQGDGRWTCPP
jgi:hypothetical protein